MKYLHAYILILVYEITLSIMMLAIIQVSLITNLLYNSGPLDLSVFDDNSTPSRNGEPEEITRPEEVSRMRCNTVATKNSKFR